MKNNATIATVGTLAFALVVLIGVNLLSSTLVRSARIDLTENGLYTLSDGTRGVLESLDDPVTLRLFLSREMSTRLPGINAYATRVGELLEEFARIGGDDVRLEVIDPEPFSEEEDRAVASGLEGVPVGDGDALFYFGLVASGPTGEQEVIPFFSIARGEFLEYDVTRMIHRVANPELPVVGLLSTLPMDGSPGPGGLMGGMPRPWAMYRQLEQFFEIRAVEPGVDRIDDDVDVLVVVHPTQLDERTLYAVDQFVLGGGNALVFVDGYAETDPTSRMQGPGYAGNDALDRLLGAWGLALRTQSVAADIALATRVRARANERNVLVDYPVWLNLRPELYDEGDVVTGQLGDVVMASPGVLDLVEREGVNVTPLIRTTESASVIDPARLGFGSDPTDLVRNYAAGGEPLVLAARVSGSIATAFPDGAPAEEDADGEDSTRDASEDATGESESVPHLAESQGETDVIVIADTDFLLDQFWVTTQQLFGTELLIPTASNNTLVINAVENLAGDRNLISIRSRGGHDRPFTLLENVRRQAEADYLQKEQELLDELAATEQRLVELQDQGGQGESMILTAEQAAELERFRERKVSIRRELREVRRNLREDIDNIQSWVRFVNIGLVPLLVGIGGIVFAAGRHARGRKRS